ncbi:MAG TPA: NADH-quinone oxidoreductase subunit L [Acidimicrobiales bacterium]|nr:NADH-quinone oxidoreductase subunit L [Acidimicrobiales bacterium]
MLAYAWVIPAVMVLSFALILFFGKRLPRKGHEIGLAAIAIAFALSTVCAVEWVGRPSDLTVAPATAEAHGAAPAEAEHEVEPIRSPVVRTATWFENGPVKVNAGIHMDGLAVVMLFVVTLISLAVHVFSTSYMHDDRRYTHFFAALSLFTAGMLIMVTAGNTLQLLFGWEMMGLCSFMLIGHWWEEKNNSDAALKAFFTTRTGDIGLLVGISILFFAAGTNFDIAATNRAALSGDISHTVLLAAAAALFCAVIGKSAQFPLHTWLPDAMAGPTPVSALIHAATMVVAGVYLVARMYGVFWSAFDIGGGGINPIALIGGITVIIAALLAFVQSDIKKVLAYSTVSQLGYMVMALGVGAWTAGIFHLFTHAFFKGLLFLGAGSVSHAVHSFDMKKDMGGMRKFMPTTYKTFMVGTLALAGIFPLAGFWSKDEILLGAGENGYELFLVVGLVGAFMTAAYMTRCVYLTFHGEPRGHAADADHPPHESGPRIVRPLYILTGLAIVAGFVNLPNTGVLEFVPDSLALRFEHFYEPKGEYFPSVLASFSHPEFNIGIAVASTLIGLLGIGLAYAWYFRGLGPHGITQRNKVARVGPTILVEKYGFDRLYTGIIANGVKGPVARGAYWFNQKGIDGVINGAGATAVKTGRLVYDKIDQGLVDTIVNGSGAAAEGSGQGLRHMQTGRVQQYAAFLFAGAAILAAIFIIVI